MPLQGNAEIGLAYIAETTWGTTPAGALSELRALSDSIDFKRPELKSQEFKQHRQTAGSILGNHEVNGSINAEFGDYLDAWLESALMGAFASNVLKLGQTVKTFTVEKRLARVGWALRYAGVRANGLKLSLKPGAIAQAEFPVIGKTLTTNADCLNSPTGWLVNNVAGYAAGSTTMAIDTGSTNPAANDQFTIYNAGSTTTQRGEQIYTVSSYSAPNLTFTPALDVAISDNDILHFCKPATVINSNDPMNAFDGVLQEGGSTIAIVTGIDLSLGQGIEPANTIGANTPAALVAGAVELTGTMDLYVQNLALLTKFTGGTYSTLSIALTNGSATYTILLPRIKYAGAKITKSQGGSPVVMQMPFSGFYDGATELTSMKITKS